MVVSPRRVVGMDDDDDRLIGIDEIRAAHKRIAPYITRTPLIAMADASVLLKAESLQAVGSFKLRGAINTMLGLNANQRSRGVVAHSSGNHAIAVAYAGSVLDIAVTVVMPHNAPTVKFERTRAFGARIVEVGPASSERVIRAQELAERDGLTLIEPYDSYSVLTATATIAVEILEDLPVDSAPTIHVPVSGGGLAGGVAAGAKLLDPTSRVIAVEPEVAADYVASRLAGERLDFSAEQMNQTMADGLRVQQVGELPWSHLQAFVSDATTVSEHDIAQTVDRIFHETGLIAEPSGAVSVAAALRASADDPMRQQVAVLTGANVDRSADD